MNDSLYQNCPICGNLVNQSERYPKYVCTDCQMRLTDFDGRLVYYMNTHIMGYGCQSYYKDTNHEPYNSNICYVDGVKCIAEEAHLGGIVIQAI